MPLNSAIFKGTVRNARLEQAAVGPPPIKAAPPADDVDAIRQERFLFELIDAACSPRQLVRRHGEDGQLADPCDY